MYWATIVMFDALSPQAIKFFDYWSKVSLNYAYYANLFKFDPSLYRNDFAVTLALHLLNGGVPTTEYDLHYTIPTATPDVSVESVEPLRLRGIGKCYHDVHVLNKKSLLEAVCGVTGF
jgi:hypothetical protein